MKRRREGGRKRKEGRVREREGEGEREEGRERKGGRVRERKGEKKIVKEKRRIRRLYQTSLYLTYIQL